MYLQADPNINLLLTKNICDGHNDCADGWDESPHLCIGMITCIVGKTEQEIFFNLMSDLY